MPKVWGPDHNAAAGIPNKYSNYLELMTAKEPHKAIAGRWALFTTIAMDDLATLPHDNSLTVRYEDFCDAPLATTENIYKFLNLDLPKEVRSWLSENTKGGDREHRYGTSRNSRQMAFSWETQLHAEVAEEIASICSEPMLRVGYSASPHRI